MMELSLRKEQFSHAYVRAVASVAGFSAAIPEVDDDSVDLLLSGRSVSGIPCRPRIELQLKCTSDDVIRGDKVIYPLKRKNYDELRTTDLLVPRLLVVIHVPESEKEWLRHSEDELAMRRCGYWASLWGEPETTNATKVTVYLPRANVFDVAGLCGLMERAARRETL
jgi:hypothetical protein